MIDSNLRERLEKYKYVTHVVVAMTVGLALIFSATRVKEHETTHDLLNEFGIAIVIAAIVTLMYETYAREVLASETMTRVVAAVMGDLFDTQLWDELRRQLIEKTAVRKELSVTARLERDPALPNYQAILWLSMSYRLHPLRKSADQELYVRHYLDRFMHNKTLDLPRFTHIAVGGEVVDPRGLRGTFEQQVTSDEWDDGVPVVVERKEIVYTPGSYSLLMSDLTSVEIIRLQDVPRDVTVEINWTLDTPHGLNEYQACAVRRMLLPGHAIEFRFNPNAPSTSGGGTVSAS